MRLKYLIFFLVIKLQNNISSAQSIPGSITVAASEQYKSTSFFRKIFFGNNYRKEWETPVTMPIFDLQKSGFKIVEMGGGQQTTSLELVDKDNREWALRSVDKKVKAPMKFMQNTFIERIIQDHVSAAYPYAGLSVPDISRAAGVATGHQELVYVPDDTAFGQYRSAMANKVFILVNNQSQAEKGITTNEMMEKVRSGGQYFVDQKAYLKARLVDWLVADWDRHKDQWRWVEKKTASGISFYVVPRDRDQAFFKSNGLLVKFISMFFMPQLIGFRKSSAGIKRLCKKSRYMDIKFTNRLQKKDWEMIIGEFQNNVTDSVIERAIKKQPPEIFAIRGKEMIEKLKSRRDGLLKNGMKYYSFLQRIA
jgi:hypothetical protein